MGEVVGQAADWLVRAQTLAGQEARKRDQESPVDSLFADILRTEMKADIALLPGVGYGAAIPPGPITAAQLRQLLPHDGKVVTMKLTGQQLKDVLEQAVQNAHSDDPEIKVGGMIQISGMRFEYDPSGPAGETISLIELDEGTWDLTANYRLATNSMLADGGHNYQTRTQGRERKEHESQYETIRRWIQEHSPVSTPTLGRIRKLDTK